MKDDKVKVMVLKDGLMVAPRVYRAGTILDVRPDHPLARFALEGRRFGEDRQLGVIPYTNPQRKRNGHPRGEYDQAALFFRLKGGLGDVLMTTVAARLYRETFPNAWITMGIPEKYCPTQEGNPDLNEVIPMTAKLYRSDFQTEFDSVYNLTTVDARYEGARMPNVDKGRLEIYCEEVGLGSPSSWLPFYRVNEQERDFARDFLNNIRGSRVGIVLRTDSIRRDPSERLLKTVSRYLIDRLGCSVFLFDGHAAAGWSEPNVYKVCGMSIRQAAGILEAMDVVLAPDTGFLHLAAAMEKPIVSLFGPTDPRCRTHRYKRVVNVWGVQRCQRAPCWYGPAEGCARQRCLEFNPEDVFLAVVRGLQIAGVLDLDRVSFKMGGCHG
jgi:ADP-heptose:LPS heptosyltransferase